MQHIKIKPGVALAEQAEIGHNRWHPDIPFLTSVKPGEEILIESLDFLDAQIKDTDDVSDVKNVDLTRAHPLTGPFYVEGAEPGDLLVIDLLDIQPISAVGFSGGFACPLVTNNASLRFHSFKSSCEGSVPINPGCFKPAIRTPGI